MSWCGGGEIRPTPGVEWRTLAMVWSTLWPGNCPPSPGFAPCAILICIMSELTRYSAVTPKRPDATCLMADRIESPFGSGLKRSVSSPPSPVFDLPPIRFIAMASVVWASREIEPNDMAPVKSLHDACGGLDLVKRNGLAAVVFGSPDAEQSANGKEPLGLFVAHPGISFVGVRQIAAHRMLQRCDGLCGPDVIFATDAELIIAADIECVAIDGSVAERVA